MKKVILSTIMAVFAISMSAQINPHAIGLRLGGSNSFGTEISYQHKLSTLNRFEADLGLRSHDHYSAFGLSGVYQWVWAIDGGFSWFAGVGGQIGSWSVDHDYKTGHDDSGMWLSILGQIGVEYQFSEIPIQIGLDLRPGIGLVNADYGQDLDLALSVRYTF